MCLCGATERCERRVSTPCLTLLPSAGPCYRASPWMHPRTCVTHSLTVKLQLNSDGLRKLGLMITSLFFGGCGLHDLVKCKATYRDEGCQWILFFSRLLDWDRATFTALMGVVKCVTGSGLTCEFCPVSQRSDAMSGTEYFDLLADPCVCATTSWCEAEAKTDHGILQMSQISCARFSSSLSLERTTYSETGTQLGEKQ